ncbi:disease resistance protein RPM1-like [Macadamia integrifolia]|uniref:disease resistance protein RPM1-like n=1 Tax=Macadamia integrifolia TaxID=60698 RepID=UPI001C4F497A|nr:disease resistance protein RPM1-like [Macadamia integrifolia]
MAEVAVSSVISQLYLLLNQEANFLKGIQGEIEFINDELESMQSFLKDADARGESDDSVKTWVKQVRKVAHDIEDVIDEFMILSASRPQHGMVGLIRRFAFSIKNLIPRHVIANELQNLRTRVIEINGRRERYRFDSSRQVLNPSSSQDLQMASLYAEEAELVGIEKPRDDLLSLLMEEESRRTVISVVGMGGCGKTTLTKKVYDNYKVISCFECRAWVTVSQSPMIDELLRMMIKQFHESMNKPNCLQVETMERNQLIDLLRKYLKEKRYVVVLDDVWSIDFWVSMKYSLPDDNQGSRVIITTRNRTVASSCLDPCNHVYTLQPLATKEAWELFCRRTFQSNPIGCCPPELEQLSLKIVNKCGGLPLAIAAMGGLLSTKDKIVAEWTKLNHSLGYELENNPLLTGIPEVLSLSLHDLPYNLKACFLYFGLFPEDYSIGCRRLFRLWAAEGFVSGEKGKTPSQVAEDYLSELIHRSMIQISSMYSDGRVKSCRVHDLMHDIIISKSKDWNFSEIVAEQNSNPSKSARRLSFHNNKSKGLKTLNFSHLRSFLLFGVHKDLHSFTKASIWNLKLLKVLDLEDSCLDKLPYELGNLLHLRYLNVRNTNIKRLPNSIGKLQNLEILNVKDTYVHELPIGILKLRKLQQLLGYTLKSFNGTSLSPLQGLKASDGIGSLENLQKLAFIEANHGTKIVQGLRGLRQLRRLGITKLRSEDSGDLCNSLEEMEYLKSLSLKAMDDKQFIDLQTVLSPPCCLQRLYLDGPLKKLPDWIISHQNLVRIRLAWSRLRDDPLQVLQTLPSLVDLALHEAYDGDHLHLKASQFKKLKILRLLRLGGLKHVIIGDGAAPSLERLTIVYCRLLEEIPLGIQNLKILTTLEILGVSTELDMKLKAGTDYWKVKHIPNIRCW